MKTSESKEDSRHNYEYSIDLKGDSAPAKVIRMVGQEKRVLEIGAGPGSITQHLKDAGRCRVTALEVDESAIVKLAPFCEKIYPADLNDPAWPDLFSTQEKFDVVVAADVLEHLYDPWLVLDAMKSLIVDNGHVVISLPHVGHNAIAACLLDENFEYRDWGLLDRTHIRFFGLKNIQSLFEGAGLVIEEAEFVIIRPEDTEFSDQWKKLSSDVRQALSSNQHGWVYQVVIKAALKSNAGQESIDLMSMSADTLSKTEECWIKPTIRSMLPHTIRVKMHAIARTIGLKG